MLTGDTHNRSSVSIDDVRRLKQDKMELQRRLETLQAQLSDAQRDHTNKYSTADTSLTYTDRQTDRHAGLGCS